MCESSALIVFFFLPLLISANLFSVTLSTLYGLFFFLFYFLIRFADATPCSSSGPAFAARPVHNKGCCLNCLWVSYAWDCLDALLDSCQLFSQWVVLLQLVPNLHGTAHPGDGGVWAEIDVKHFADVLGPVCLSKANVRTWARFFFFFCETSGPDSILVLYLEDDVHG